MNNLREGVRIKAAWYGGGQGGYRVSEVHRVKSMVVTMEPGVDGHCAFIRVTKNDGSIILLNCMEMEEIELEAAERAVKKEESHE